MTVFDLVVIGSGPGGYPAAIRAAQGGKKVALVEEKELGGTCLNRGCIPSKALISCANMYRQIENADKFGIKVEGVTFDYEKMVAHKERVVRKIRQGLEGLLKANKIIIYKGRAKYLSRQKIKILGEDTVTLEAKASIIAAGSEPFDIPQFPFDYKYIHDSTSILEMRVLPKRLAIIGAGYIGCEFASLYSTLGVEVTLIEALDRILPFQDAEAAALLTQSLVKKGVQMRMQTRVLAMNKIKEGVVIDMGPETLDVDCALVCVGRKLNGANMGLETIGVQLDESGKVIVNEKMETTVPSVYALGDIASNWQLAHVATHQGVVAADNILGRDARMDYHAVPSVIFTDPEIAEVGYSLQSAQKAGFHAIEGRFPMSVLGKAQASLEADGYVKIITAKETGQILGAQAVGYQASTLIAEMALAIKNELTIESIQETIHAHPTLSEAWMEAAFLAQGMPLHMPPKNLRTTDAR